MKNVKKRGGQKETQCSLARKRTLVSFTTKSCAKGETPVTKEISAIVGGTNLHWNKRKGPLEEKPHPTKLPTCERQMPRNFLILETNNRQKLLPM